MANQVRIGDYVRINETFVGDWSLVGKAGYVRVILMPENHPGVLLDQPSPYGIVLAHHSELDILVPAPVRPPKPHDEIG
jgi:hypothetical protein